MLIWREMWLPEIHLPCLAQHLQSNKYTFEKEKKFTPTKGNKEKEERKKEKKGKQKKEKERKKRKKEREKREKRE